MKNKTLLLLALLTASVQVSADDTQIVINEIQVTNIDQFIDLSYNYGGWIELYNPTSEPVNVGSWVVSDNVGNTHKLVSNEGTVPAGGFMTIWFDHSTRDTQYSAQAYKQVPFKLQYEGGIITLSDASGKVIDSQSYPPAIQRASYARTTDGGDTWSFTGEPTPAASNNGSTFATEQLPMPEIDHDATVYREPFVVKVKIPEGAVLRYTTDGSTPTATQGETSTDGTFNVAGQTQIFRFRLFKDGYLPSSVATRSYIYMDKNYTMPIVSVVTDAKNLYDNKIGAFTDGTNGTSGNNKNNSNKNRAWERPVNFEYFVPSQDGGTSYSMAINQECDFEVCGGWSRHFAPDGSFRLKGSKYYLGQNFLPYPFFDEKPFIKNKTIVVRNGGNDNYGRIHDALIHQIILRSGFYVDCQSWQPAHIFINGVYKYMFNIREPNNKNHAYANYGIDDEELDQFEINGTKGYEQKTGTTVAFRRWMTLATSIARTPSDESLYDQVCQLVDVDEYANYMAAECYSGCGDWYTNSNNAKGYRSQADGKFHMIFMDQDQGFGETNIIGRLAGSLYDSRYDTGRNFLIDIFLNMLKNARFKKRFIDAFCIVNGSVFEPEFARAVANDMLDYALPAMALEGHDGNMRSSANSVLSNMTSNGNRNSRINSIRNYFGLANGYNVKLTADIPDAALLLNGQPIPRNIFNGTMFAPAILTAKAPAGYRFRGWVADAQIGTGIKLFDTDAEWKYFDQGSLDDVDWRAASYDEESWKTGKAPLGYGNVGMSGRADYNTTLDYGNNPERKRPTYYFRKVLHLDKAPAKDDIYQLTYYADDGVIAYVNGTEVSRYLMNGGESHYADYSTTYVGSQAAAETVVIDNALLHAGDNIIAVEVHNTSATSSDIYWTATVSHVTNEYSSYLSTDENLDLSTLGESQTLNLLAAFEPLPDDDLIANMAVPVKVNEVGASNTVFINDLFKKNDWIELYNTTDSPIDAAGLYVSDDLDNPLKYQIPSGTVNTIIPAYGHLVIWADKLEAVTQLHAPFKLGNNDAERVVITSSRQFEDNNPAYFAAHPFMKGFADCLTYNAHNGDESAGRYPDGAHSLYRMTRPTIAWKNYSHSFDEYLGEEENVMDDIPQADFALRLVEGWNWISHPLDNPIPVSRFKDHALQVRSQSLEAHYSSTARALQGSLTALQPASLYKFEAGGECTYQLAGQLLTPLTPLALRSGWNWIGYPATGLQSLGGAFAGDPDVGDILMGQNGFSIYTAEQGWVGTLSTLVPGQGYMYKTSKDKNLTFNPPASSARLSRSRWKSASEVHYNYDKYAYPDVMGIVCTLCREDRQLPADEFTLLAFVGDECRGVASVVGDNLMLTIYGAEGDQVAFRAIDAQGQEYEVTPSVTFVSDVQGTLSSPLVFQISDQAIDLALQPITATASLQGFYTLGGVYVGVHPRHLTDGIYIVRYTDGSHRKVLIK